VPGARVVLHRVGRATQGPIDSTTTEPTGRFRFAFPLDTTANYLVSVRFAGIEYFSDPIVTDPTRPPIELTVLVSDTSSSAPVRVRTRTFVVSAPDAIGARTVVDWLVLHNPGSTTRVAADSNSPTWQTELPAGARNTQVGDPRLSQFSPEAIEFRGDSVYLSAPISPGDKELLLQYELPSSQRRFTVSVLDVDSVEAFFEDRAIETPPRGWAVSDSQAFEGRRFRRLTRTDPTLARLELRFPGVALAPERLLVWLVVGFALAMIGAGWWLVRIPRAIGLDREPDPAAVPAALPAALADEIVRLDQELARDTPDRDGLAARRETLRARLEAALARSRGSS
jgi:hypothetical protein